MQRINLQELFEGLSPEDKMRQYRALWHQAERFEVLTSFPLHLDLELSGICNLKCAHCFQSGLITQRLDMMPFELFTKIIDEGSEKGLCAIKLQVRGESLLHPRFVDCIAYAKAKGIIDVQVTTNATLLKQDMAQRILEAGLDAIIFSVDSHHGDNYLDRNATYTAIEDNIHNFIALKKEMGLKKPWVRIQSSIPLTDPASYQSAKQYIEEKFPDADIHVVNRIYDFTHEHDAFSDLKTNYTLNPCCYLLQRLAIFWDGTVTFCCEDYNNVFQLGDLNTQTMEEIWNSEKMDGYRKLHIEGRRLEMPVCKNCGACITLKSDQLVYDTTKQHGEDY